MRQVDASVLLANIADDPKVIFVTGKGGVGKTVVSNLLVQAANISGIKCAEIVLGDFSKLEIQDETLAASVDNHDLEPATPKDLNTNSSQASDHDIINIDPADALVEYLQDHGFGKLASRLIGTGVIGVVSTAIPGIRDLLILGKIKQIERSGKYDLLVVDSPATGHTLSFLTSPEGLRDIAEVGPLRAQAEDVITMLSDPSRCGCVIVTIPEETPVAETIELCNTLETRLKLKITSIVVNQLLPDIAALSDEFLSADSSNVLVKAYLFSKSWREIQATHLAKLEESFDGKIVRLPFVAGFDTQRDVASEIIQQIAASGSATRYGVDEGSRN